MARRYLEIWEKDPQLSSWLCEDKESGKAFCIVCKSNLIAHKTSLQKHSKSQYHLREIRKVKEEELQLLREEYQEYRNVEGDIGQVINKTETYYYNKDWESLDDLRLWLRPVHNDYTKAHCNICNENYVAKLNVLISHKDTIKHRGNAGEDVQEKFNATAASVSIRVAGLVADKNLSFLFGEELTLFLQDLIVDSEILKDVSLDRKKISSVITNVIAPAQQDRLAEILKNQKFSIEIDESTDITTHQSMCIVVRYFDNDRDKICDSLWDLVPTLEGDEHASANADTIINCICNSFQIKEVPLSNIIAFCSDTCSLMMGCKNSVSTKLKELIPNLEIIKCKCHIAHLCAQNAMKVLPCNEFASHVYNYISGSSKRQSMWKKLQEKLGLEPLIIVKPIFTRWLSYYQCVLRLLRRWDALKIYFDNELRSGNQRSQSAVSEKSAETILQYLQDPVNLLFHTFLENVLGKFTHTNQVLQHEKPIVPTHDTDVMRELYTDLLKMYMNNEYVNRTSLNEINPNNTSEFKDLENLDLGSITNAMVKHLKLREDDDITEEELLINCRAFLIEGCIQLKERCEFDDDRLVKAKYFHPKNSLNQMFHKTHPNMEEVIEAYKCIEVHEDEKKKINAEWRQLLDYDFSEEIQYVKDAGIFWAKMKREEKDGELLFDNIATFALNVLCIPNSNASPERVWSKYVLEKTKIRNRLSFDSIRGILLAAQYIKDVGGILHFKATPEMMKRIKELQYAHKKKFVPESSNKEYGNILSNYGNIRITNDMIMICQHQERAYEKQYRQLRRQNDCGIDGINMQDIDNDSYYAPVKLMKLVNDADLIQRPDDAAINDVIGTISFNLIDNNTVAERSDINHMKNDKNLENHVVELLVLNENDLLYVNNNASASKMSDKIANKNRNCSTDSGKKWKIIRTLNIMENGLVSNCEHYICKNYQFTIGRYPGRIDHPIRDYRDVDEMGEKVSYPPTHEFQLFSREYQTLFEVGVPGYLDSDVIDALVAIKEHEWIDVVAFPTQQTKILLVQAETNEMPGSNWSMFHIKRNISEVILMPYEKGNHWCLFVADIVSKQTWHLDPFYIEKEISESSKKCFQNFNNYLTSSCNVKKNNVNTTQWTNIMCTMERKLQDDEFNCGLHVLHYMDCIGRDIPFDMNFDPMKARLEIAETLLKKSENMQNICLFCLSNKVTGHKKNKITCIICQRFAHVSCLALKKIMMLDTCFLCSKK